MPLLSSQSGISAKALGLTSSQFSAFGNGYWGQLLKKTGSTNYQAGYSVAVDSSDNILFGTYYTEANIESCAFKVNSSGVLQWQKKISTAQSDYIFATTVDSSNNLIVVGSSGSNGFGYVGKFDASGSLTWAKDFIGVWTNVYAQSVKTDSSNNIYISGVAYTGTTNTFDAFVIKLNSSGTVQWQRYLGSVNTESFQGVAVDGSGNVYASGITSGGPVNTALVVKYNSSGVLQWQKELTYVTSVLGSKMALDSSGNLYWAGWAGVCVLIKFDPSGNVLWQKAGSLTNTQWTDIHIDSLDNIYMYGAQTGFIAIAKYNTSGNVVYRRQISGSSPGGIFAKGSDIYILGYVYSGTSGLYLYKLPSDGSKTGVYNIGGNTVVYTGYNDVDISGPITVSAGTEVDSAGNFTFSTAAATISTDTFTQTIQY